MIHNQDRRTIIPSPAKGVDGSFQLPMVRQRTIQSSTWGNGPSSVSPASMREVSALDDGERRIGPEKPVCRQACSASLCFTIGCASRVVFLVLVEFLRAS